MKELSFVSIIIVNYDGKKWLKDCFESLEKLDYLKDKYEVIMGDNASSDDSVEYTKKNFPWIRVLQFDKNYGFCKANNLCAKESKGEYLIFLNNDTTVTKSWLKNLVDGVLSEEYVISCACKMLYYPSNFNGKYIINTAGGKISPSGGGFYTGMREEDKKIYNIPRYTGFGCGAGVLIEKKFFIKTGGFDEQYIYGVEEMDLGLRVWMYGYKVLYVPMAVMYHFGSGTGRSKGPNPKFLFFSTLGELHFIFKNFEVKNVLNGIFYHFFIRFAMVWVTIVIYGILHRNIYISYEIIKAIIKGYFSFFRNIRETFQKRRNVQKNRQISDSELYKMGLITSFREWFKLHISLFKTVNSSTTSYLKKTTTYKTRTNLKKYEDMINIEELIKETNK
ncbi:MAG: hypothetical protein BWK75_02065 [Candidatus Altiarchaeales archaeon A3]|nr:MAG: hypothetical protein BWK75_02065 [Candidatus Altiarchaeales archaeon A3]